MRGLIVDYLGLADQLKQALTTYTERGGQVLPSPASIASQVVIVLVPMSVASSYASSLQKARNERQEIKSARRSVEEHRL